MDHGRCKRLISAALASASANTSALAQPQASCSDIGQCPDNGAIIVTGTHIAGPEASASPVQRIDAGDIDASGVVNIQDVLNDNPVFGSPAFNRTNSAFSIDAAGVATADLRNLGENRTLVLLNGRRLVPSIPGSGIVDLNIIPTQLVSRVDVLTGGASSVYGSDAIAGVVNIILDDRFDGWKAEGQAGVSDEGDDVRKQASLSYGAGFADGRGRIILHAGYSDEGTVLSASRKRTRSEFVDCFNAEGGDPFKACAPFLSSYTPQGRINTGPDNDAVFTYFGTNLVEGFFTNGAPGRAPDGYNLATERRIAIPTRRYMLNAMGYFDVSDAVRAHVEASFARSDVHAVIEPLAMDSADIFTDTGRFNIEHDVVAPGGAIVRLRNPFVQDAIFDAADDSDGDGLRDVGFRRRLTEFGNRDAKARRQTWRLLASLEGPVSSDWRWSAYYAYGRSTEDQRAHGHPNLTRFGQALQVVPDTFDVDRDGNVTEPICLDSEARAGGCVPANIFGGVGALAPIVDFVETPATLSAKVNQTLAGATLTGSLLNLPAGPVGAALGVEYRKEHSRLEFDDLTQAGINAYGPLPNTAGGFRVFEGYVELYAPILSGRRFAESLKLRGALRVAHYSTIGTSWNWHYGAEYEPVRGLRFRAVKARATRAPNIGELFTPNVVRFSFGIDPCEHVTASTPGTLGELCRSFPGVNENIAQNGEFVVTDIDRFSIEETDGGNPDLREERADSLTAGIVVNPRAGPLANLTITADYFSIKVADAIFGLFPDVVLNQCFNAGVRQLCDLVTRRPTGINGASPGSLQHYDLRLINSGGLRVKGIDATASYRTEMLGGRLDLSLSYTHLLDGFVVPVAGGPRDVFAGEIGSPSNRALASVTFERGRWGMTLRGTYTGPAFLDDQLDEVERSEKFKTGAETVMDAQVRFMPTDRFQLFAGVDNLLDNKPPLITVTLGAFPGTNTDPSVYDAIGRRFYAGARVRF